jgi:hypothetical protein
MVSGCDPALFWTVDKQEIRLNSGQQISAHVHTVLERRIVLGVHLRQSRSFGGAKSIHTYIVNRMIAARCIRGL